MSFDTVSELKLEIGCVLFIAEDLEHCPRWQQYLHELGECEVKHGVRVSVVNFYTDEAGNPALRK